MMKRLSLNEKVNSVTHLIGLGLAFIGLIYLVLKASLYGDAYHIVSVSIYGTTLILLYTASTLYHSARQERFKHFMKIFDHSSIYLLIAGSYTPFTLVSLNGGWGWSLFGVVWGVALFGIVFKIFFVNHFQKLSLLVYLMMGWLIVIAAQPAMDAIPTGGLVLLAVGGGVYTAGTFFYMWDYKIPFGHAIWHLFVLAGSILHYFSVFYYVLPPVS